MARRRRTRKRVKSSVKITDKLTRRGKKILKLNKTISKVEVGIFDPRIALIGGYHEFGTKRIPRRSFIRAWFAIEGIGMRDKLREAMTKLFKTGSVSGLNEVGSFAVNGIKTRILGKIPPKLAASTVKGKSGSHKNTPLIDRGTLFRAISYRINTES